MWVWFSTRDGGVLLAGSARRHHPRIEVLSVIPQSGTADFRCCCAFLLTKQLLMFRRALQLRDFVNIGPHVLVFLPVNFSSCTSSALVMSAFTTFSWLLTSLCHTHFCPWIPFLLRGPYSVVLLKAILLHTCKISLDMPSRTNAAACAADENAVKPSSCLGHGWLHIWRFLSLPFSLSLSLFFFLSLMTQESWRPFRFRAHLSL